MATLLPKLDDLLAEEYQLQASVRDDVAFLRAELESMEAALLRISEAPVDRPPDAQDRLWVREVRELTYDVEHCVEAFLVRLDHHAPKKDLQGLRGFIDRGLSLLKRAKICRDIGADVRNIKRHIMEVSEPRRVRYKVDGVAAKPSGPTVDSLRLSALYTKATELVGNGERSDELNPRTSKWRSKQKPILSYYMDTRILDVAKQDSASVYQLKPLSLADSRKLFYHRIFGIEDKCPPNQLAEVSENILKKCGGVPLAVITIASLLASKRRKENAEKYWYQRIMVYQKKRSYTNGVGEGFVRKQHGKTLYEVGEGYYEDVISKSMIQPMIYNHDNKVWSCCVHDMMLDLITSLSEENFLTVLGGSKPISVPNEIGNLQPLQFLDLNMTNIKELPPTFIQLRKLEFLCVDNQTRLPECLGNLKSLQKLSPPITIDQIFDCHNGLSSHIGILTPGPQQPLRSINIGPGTICRVPRWMSSLSVLSALDITLLTLVEEDLQILGRVTSLCNLYIWVKEHRKHRDKRLVISSDYPFRCLTRFRIERGAMEVEFVPGAMLKLQTLNLDFHVRHTMDQFGDFDFSLENLSSLERVIVHMNCYYAEIGEVQDAEASIRKALDLNPSKPTLELQKQAETTWYKQFVLRNQQDGKLTYPTISREVISKE
ncbi:hypothetical protein BAE44_0009526 [Dichanthelium oligosanthes]|uniref:Uncharacterized protein n=1 Tax=Dichanthelium oligosanthes TaxID=888268 RepID=A0A1E5VWG0_9POAL|nr:hypothetical protein BAE44_0009526 [Dichanthelium oligosanthes]